MRYFIYSAVTQSAKYGTIHQMHSFQCEGFPQNINLQSFMLNAFEKDYPDHGAKGAVLTMLKDVNAAEYANWNLR